MKIKTKIILAVLVPLTVLLCFTIVGISEKYQLMSEVKDLEILSNLSINISAVVHELQKERGRTGGYMGADGKEFIKELPQQRTLTDIKREDLDIFLNDFEPDKFGDEFVNKFNSVLQKFNLLENHRMNVSNLIILDREGIEFYTELNSLMLNVIAYIPKISPDPEISVLLSGYVNFLKGKEKVGIERAVMSNAFAADKFDEGRYNYFVFLINAQDTYFDSFETFATKEQINFFEEKMLNPAVAEVEKLENIATEKFVQGGFEIDAGYWFNTMTIKIDLLKEVEDKISDDLRLMSYNVNETAKYGLILFLIITFVVMSSTIALFISLLLMIKPILNVRNAAIEIAQGNMDVEIDTSSKDEIGDLSRAVEKMRESLKVVMEEYEKNIK